MNEIVSEHGKLKHINKMFSIVKIKLQKRKSIIALSSAAIMFFSGLAIGKAQIPTNQPEVNPVNIDDNQIMTNIIVNVEYDDTVYDIASKYYTDAYENVYGSIENFIKSIESQNGLADAKIEYGSMISVPVIIDRNSPILQSYISKQLELAELEENEKWIKYTAKLDDNLTELAAFGSALNYVGIDSDITQEIIKYNNLESNNIVYGQELFIINPKIGVVKSEIVELKKQLVESLKNNTKTK